MINPVSVIGLAMLGFLLVAMYMSYVADRYEKPKSYEDALGRSSKAALSVGAGFALGNLLIHGLELGDWDWSFLFGIPLTILILFGVDFVLLRRQQAEEE